ncbi:DDE superfamily endonuclease [Popillia japonica]|uniref:Putative nuclease HARBI1 n=1 Tax=Popillia japonica TaxID=7064 RepID=A0AAW1MD88_POPJA
MVTNAICDHIVHQKISFPALIEERNNNKENLLNKWGFPGVIGAVDGTHIAILKPNAEEHNFVNRKGYHSINCQIIAILKPNAEEHNFVNRKGYHSINCQIICDYKLKITNIFANYGGSSHDSFIWRNSQMNDYLRTLYQANERCWLVGNSAYPLLPYLMTPYRNPINDAEERYNQAHISARNVVERCIGLLKMRFRCLLKERTARYAPHFVCKLVKVCAALHNMCIDASIDEELPHVENEELAGHDIVPQQIRNPHEQGVQMRKIS